MVVLEMKSCTLHQRGFVFKHMTRHKHLNRCNPDLIPDSAWFVASTWCVAGESVGVVMWLVTQHSNPSPSALWLLRKNFSQISPGRSDCDLCFVFLRERRQICMKARFRHWIKHKKKLVIVTLCFAILTFFLVIATLFLRIASFYLIKELWDKKLQLSYF